MRFTRTNTAAPALSNSGGRLVSYILSTPSVARDNHTIAAAGWKLDAYKSNPVFLWAHDSNEPPIGKMVDIGTVDDQLRGTVEYADADIYPFADTIFRLVKGSFLNAVSVSWNPLKWSYTKDPSRPGGIDFTQQELLEVSQCPVPCLAAALVTARSAGIDTSPAFRWAERLLDRGGSVVIQRTELEALRRAARMPAAAPRRAGLAAFAKLDTRADREKFARFVAFDGARRGLAPVPASFLPCQNREEREAVAAFAMAEARRCMRTAAPQVAPPKPPAPWYPTALEARRARAAQAMREAKQ
jgi:HK97 family phage prohead protease